MIWIIWTMSFSAFQRNMISWWYRPALCFRYKWWLHTTVQDTKTTRWWKCETSTVSFTRWSNTRLPIFLQIMRWYATFFPWYSWSIAWVNDFTGIVWLFPNYMTYWCVGYIEWWRIFCVVLKCIAWIYFGDTMKLNSYMTFMTARTSCKFKLMTEHMWRSVYIFWLWTKNTTNCVRLPVPEAIQIPIMKQKINLTCDT